MRLLRFPQSRSVCVVDHVAGGSVHTKCGGRISVADAAALPEYRVCEACLEPTVDVAMMRVEMDRIAAISAARWDTIKAQRETIAALQKQLQRAGLVELAATEAV
jgi:hypothetical protein